MSILPGMECYSAVLQKCNIVFRSKNVSLPSKFKKIKYLTALNTECQDEQIL